MPKGRSENLTDIRSRASEVQREIRSKGGKARAEKCRRRKTMREALEMLMYKTELPAATKNMLKAEGVDEDDFNHQMVITRSLIAKAEAGDVQAYNAICGMIGEKPADKMELSGGQRMELKIEYITKSPDDAVFPSSEDEVDAER